MPSDEPMSQVYGRFGFETSPRQQWVEQSKIIRIRGFSPTRLRRSRQDVRTDRLVAEPIRFDPAFPMTRSWNLLGSNSASRRSPWHDAPLHVCSTREADDGRGRGEMHHSCCLTGSSKRTKVFVSSARLYTLWTGDGCSRGIPHGQIYTGREYRRILHLSTHFSFAYTTTLLFALCPYFDFAHPLSYSSPISRSLYRQPGAVPCHRLSEHHERCLQPSLLPSMLHLHPLAFRSLPSILPPSHLRPKPRAKRLNPHYRLLPRRPAASMLGSGGGRPALKRSKQRRAARVRRTTLGTLK